MKAGINKDKEVTNKNDLIELRERLIKLCNECLDLKSFNTNGAVIYIVTYNKIFTL